jgi:hypothetical protein
MSMVCPIDAPQWPGEAREDDWTNVGSVVRGELRSLRPAQPPTRSAGADHAQQLGRVGT